MTYVSVHWTIHRKCFCLCATPPPSRSRTSSRSPARGVAGVPNGFASAELGALRLEARDERRQKFNPSLQAVEP
jgi:hypothetical protein